MNPSYATTNRGVHNQLHNDETASAARLAERSCANFTPFHSRVLANETYHGFS